MTSRMYTPLAQDDSVERLPIYDEKKSRTRQLARQIFRLTFAISVGCNIVLLLSRRSAQSPRDCTVSLGSDVTPFAKLKWDKWIMYEHGGVYVDESDDVSDAAWEAIDYNSGSVALDDDYVAEMGLPISQRFPWDDSKGLYFMNGQHQIHCLQALRKSFLQLRDRVPLDLDWAHNMHCFNALRQEIICTADDTPRSMTFAHPGSIGVGQYRRCRDWDKMVAWTEERWSCWRNINKTDEIDTLLRYRYCPEGSPYYERIHAIFGDFEMGEGASASN